MVLLPTCTFSTFLGVIAPTQTSPTTPTTNMQNNKPRIMD